MTKATGVGRGGVRAGAGRRPVPSDVGPIDAPDDMADGPRSARDLRGLALATLKAIMEKGSSEAARVAAAREALSRADGERGPVLRPQPLGKKEAAAQAAKDRVASGGRFAPTPPPTNARTVQ